MATRLVALAFLFLAMFLCWTCGGLVMLLAPARFIRFWSGNIYQMDGKPGVTGKLFVRVIGAGFIAFAIWFALRLLELTA